MLKMSGLISLIALTAVINFSTASYAGGKKDCNAGIKEVEEQYPKALALAPGARKAMDTKLHIAKEGLKVGKFKRCKLKVTEMRKILSH